MFLTYHQELVLKKLMIEKQHAEVPIYDKLVRNAERAKQESPGEEERRYKELKKRPQTDEDNAGHPIRITPHPGQKKMLTVPSLMVNFPKISQPYILIPSDIPIYDGSLYWQMFREQKPNVIIQMASEEPTAFVPYPKVQNQLMRIVDTQVLCESVTETDLYIRRDYKISNRFHRYTSSSNLDYEPHKLIHIQYLHWSDPNNPTNPPDIIKLRQFYDYLSDSKLLVTINERPPYPVPNRTVTTSCPVLMGSASIFVIIDAIYRMVSFQQKYYQPCIEKLLPKLFHKDFTGLQTPQEILYIYEVLIMILEKDMFSRTLQAWHLKQYVDSWKDDKVINYKKFLTSGKWCPCQFWVINQLERQQHRENDEASGAQYVRSLTPQPVLLPLSTD